MTSRRPLATIAALIAVSALIGWILAELAFREPRPALPVTYRESGMMATGPCACSRSPCRAELSGGA